MVKDFSIQLYSVRDKTEKDFIGTLEKLSAFGYNGVEFAGFGGISALDMRSHLDRLGLRAVSSHNGTDDLVGEDLKRQLEYLNIVGSKYIVCPYYHFDGIDDVYKLAELLNKAGEESQKNGITLGYHNHDGEFATANGRYYLDLLIEQTEPTLVKIEFDVFWAEHAGVNCFDYLRSHPARCELIHLKQIDDKKKSVDLPDGIIDMKKLIELGRSFGIKTYIVEQEEYKVSSLESARINAEYLEKIM